MRNKQFYASAKLTLVVAIMLCIASVRATAVDTIDGICYSLSGSEAKVTSLDPDKYSGDVVIPSEVTYKAKTYKVTSIGYSAFADCSGLTSVTIPGSVTSIGYSAFADCSGLTSVTIPGGVTSIGSLAFYDCSELTSVSLPESLTKIDSGAFSNCSMLQEIWNYGLSAVEIDGVFDKRTYYTATLYVRDVAYWEYTVDFEWRLFKNIKTFDPSNPTAISAPAYGDSTVTISRVGGNAIFVDGANGKPVTVYDAAGHTVSRGKTTVSGLPHGLYIVRFGGRSYKVAM